MSADAVLPHDLRAESHILGLCLLQPDLRVPTARDGVRPEDFFRDAHQRLFAAILAVWDAGTAVGLSSVVAHLDAAGDLARVGGVEYLASLDRGLPAGDIAPSVAVVRQHAQRRALIAEVERLRQQAQDTTTATDAVLVDAERALRTLTLAQSRDGFVSGTDILAASLDTIEALAEGRLGVTTGYRSLDAQVGGYAPGQLVLIAGRPGQGKSAIVTSALTRWLSVGLHVGVVSLEMTVPEVGMRWLSSEGSIDMRKARVRALREMDYRNLSDAMDRVRGLSERLHVTDVPSLTLSRIRAAARRCAAEHGLDVLVIDYLQLISSESRSESRYREITEISIGLKQLAKELRVPIICLAQLNRQNEARRDKRPSLSDLRDSGQLEQDADLVLLLHREEVYERTPDNAGKAEVIVAKGRNVPLGVVHLRYIAEFTRFEEVA